MIWFPDVPDWFADEVTGAFALQDRYGDDETGFLAALAHERGPDLGSATADTAAAVVLRLACLVAGYGDVSTLPVLVETDPASDTARRLVALAAAGEEEAAHQAARSAMDDHAPVHLFGLLILAFPEPLLI